jgi:hypothetical protein
VANEDEIIEHRYKIEALENSMKEHSKEIKSLAKMQNRLIIALIVITILGSDSAAPVVMKLIGG